MNLPLDILALLVTGAYTLFSGFLIVFMATSRSPVKQFASIHHQLFYRSSNIEIPFERRKHPGPRVLEPSKVFVGSIVIAFVFTFGMAVDHLSDRFQDKTKQLFFFSYIAADTDNFIKAKAFIKVYNSREDKSDLVDKLKSCFDKLSSTEYGFFFNKKPNFEKKSECSNAINVAKEIYYKSKNTVYQHPNYYSDLTHIRTRLDFKRSMTFITAIIVYALVFGIMLCSIRKSLEIILKNKLEKFPFIKNILFHYSELHFRKLIALLIVTLSLWYLMVSGWSHQEEQYALRAFGYYTSLSDALMLRN